MRPVESFHITKWNCEKQIPKKKIPLLITLRSSGKAATVTRWTELTWYVIPWH